MPDTYTSSTRVIQMAVGGDENTWGANANAAYAMLDEAVAGQVSVSVTAGNVSLSTANNATDQSRPALLILTGTPGVPRTVTMPDVKKIQWVFNNSDSTVTLTAGVGTTVALLAGEKEAIYTDGATNVATLSPTRKTGTFTPVLRFGSASVGLTYTVQQGRFTKIDDQCFFEIAITINAMGSSTGVVDITGLPFTAAFLTQIPAYGNNWNIVGGIHSPFAFIAAGGTGLTLYRTDTGLQAQYDDTNFTSGSVIYINGRYKV